MNEKRRRLLYILAFGVSKKIDASVLVKTKTRNSRNQKLATVLGRPTEGAFLGLCVLPYTEEEEEEATRKTTKACVGGGGK